MTVLSPNGEGRGVVCRQENPGVLGGSNAGQNVAPRHEDDPIQGDGELNVRSKRSLAGIDPWEHLGIPAAGKVLAVASYEEDLVRVSRERTVEVRITRRGILFECAIGVGGGQYSSCAPRATNPVLREG